MRTVRRVSFRLMATAGFWCVGAYGAVAQGTTHLPLPPAGLPAGPLMMTPLPPMLLPAPPLVQAVPGEVPEDAAQEAAMRAMIEAQRATMEVQRPELQAQLKALQAEAPAMAAEARAMMAAQQPELRAQMKALQAEAPAMVAEARATIAGLQASLGPGVLHGFLPGSPLVPGAPLLPGVPLLPKPGQDAGGGRKGGPRPEISVKDDLFAGTEKFAKNAKEATEVNMTPDDLEEVRGPHAMRARETVLNVVHSYEFERPGMFNMADVDEFRHKLDGPGWHCTVRTRDLKSGGSTDVCSKRRTDGLRESAVITVEPKELTFIHRVERVSDAEQRHGGEGDSE